MNGFDWVFLIVVGGLCALYGSSGYFVGYAHRNDDDAALLRRLANTSRQASYDLARPLEERQAAWTNAADAEDWAERLAPVAECDADDHRVEVVSTENEPTSAG